MADQSRARRLAGQAATLLPGRSVFAKQQTKIVAALAIAMLLISNIPASALGRIGTLSAANIIASSFSGQTMPILDCGPGSPYGSPCNPGGEWSDLNGHPGGIPGGALLVSGLQPGDKLAINNISGTINEGNALASCRNGLDPQDTALPKLIGIVQFTNDAGQVVSVGGGVNNTNAMYLNSFEGAGLTVPAGATKMYGSFPDTVYSDNQGSCSFTISVTPASTGGGGPCTISDKATFQQYVQNGQVSFQFFNDPSKAESSITVSNNSACTITGTSLQIDSIFQNGDQNDINSAMYKSQQPFYESPIQSVPPGQSVNFWAKNPGCDFQEDLAFNHAPGFGQVELNQPGGFCPSVNSAQCVSITAPDTVTPGQQFPVTVVMKNTSSYGDWFGEGLFHYPYRLGEVAANGTYDQGDWGAGRVNMTDGLVTPGNNETFNFTATAPTTPGTYNSFNFRMLEEGHEWFGGNIPIPIPNASICSKTITVANAVSSSSSSSSVSSSASSVNGNANLSITKSADQSSVVAGGTASYTVTVTNSGPATAMHVTVTDTAPAGFTLTNSDAGCFQNGQTVTCILGSLQPGTRSIHMSFAVPNPGNCSATQTVTNNASVRADNLGSGNTTASAQMQVTCPATSSSSSSSVNGNANLSITKAADQSSVVAGGTASYTINVTNSGPAAATNTVVKDTAPAGFTLTNSDAGCFQNAQTVTCILGTLQQGTRTIHLTFTVPNPGNCSVTQTVTNTANVSANNLGTGTTSASAPMQVTCPATSSSSSSSVSSAPTMTNMTITKTGPASVTAGQNATYLLHLHNSGPVDAQNVQVVDVMGSRFNYVSSPDTNCSVQNGNNLLCNVGTVGNGQDRTVTLVLNVIGSSDVCSAGQTFNVGTVGGTNVQNSINSISTVYTPISCVSSSSSSSSSINTNADISVSKTASSQIVTVGQNVTYTIQVHNNGPADAQNVSVNDQLPSGLSLVTDLVTQGTYNGSVWNVGTLANGQTATLQVIATVTSAGQITNTATGTSNNPDNNTGNNTGSVTITGQPASSSSSSSSSSSTNNNADISVTKTASSTNVSVGQNVIYTVFVHNNGPADASNVSVADTLPQGLTYVSSFATQGNYSNGVWNVGTLSDNQNAQLQIVAMVTSAGQITNTATGTSNNPDNNTGNNTGSVTITGQPASSSSSVSSSSSSSSSVSNIADLSITKTANNSSVNVGSPVIYSIAVHNNGPADAPNVSVNDLLPAGVSFITYAATQGTYNNQTGVWSVGTVGNSQTATLQIVVNVISSGQITNTATTTSTNPDNNPGNNTSSVTINGIASSSSSSSSSISSSSSSINTNADISVTKTASSQIVTVGQNVTYTIQVHNNGPADAQNVSVNDLLPQGLTFVTSGATQGTYNNQTGVWSVGTVGNSQTATLQIVAMVTSAGQITNTATGTSNNPDNNTGNNTGTVTITGQPASSSSSSISSSSSSVSSVSTNADISVTKTASSQIVTVGQNVTYTVQVHNNGPADAQNVSVNDQLPSGLSLVTDLVTQGTYNGSVWNVGMLANGQTATLQVIATVTSAGQITNTATGTSNNPDNNTGNNTGTVTITGQPASSSSSVSSSSSSLSSSSSSQPPLPGCIQILKEAYNANGQSLSPVPQFTFRLDNGQTVTSDANGNARFDNVSVGNHTVTEVVPAGWNQILVTPQNGQLFVPSGSFCAGIAFKNQQTLPASSSSSMSSVTSSQPSSSSSSAPPLMGCINVQKQAYNAAGNPITPVPQFVFTLDGNQTAMNDANGNAFFGNVPPGNHTITESLPNGWAQIQSLGTVSVQGGMSCANALFKNQQTVPPSSSSSSSSSMISSSSSSSSSQQPIVGCVSILKETFDQDGNSLTPVAPFQFQLDNNGPVVMNDANGYARFDNVTPGMHTITEIPQNGWNQILVTPQGGQINVPSGNLCAGIVFKNQKTGGSQNVIINSNSNTSVNSTINANSNNTITINQNGGGNQNAGVNGNANTSVDSTINAVSGNLTNVTQNGPNSAAQNALINTQALNNVGSMITATGGNAINIDQNNALGIGTQNAAAVGSGTTGVTSMINALSGNATNVQQNSNPLNPNPSAPIHLIPLTNAAQPQGQIPAFNVTTTVNTKDQQGMMNALLSWIDQLRQQILTMFGGHQ